MNRSKSDRDPAEWLPEHNQCRYVGEWVAVKLRWELVVDRDEKEALSRLATQCKNDELRWEPATVGYR